MNFIDIITNFIRGMIMAFADSVPGVSGGTIAFILGFYDRFILSLDTLFSKSASSEDRKESITFLSKIGVGWIFGFLTSVIIISSLFEEYIYQISSLFVGFIFASIPLVISEEKETLKGKYQYLIFTLAGALLVFTITYFNGTGSGDEGISLKTGDLTILIGISLFIAGIIAVSTMVLPGISGSTVLLILGLYAPIIFAVHEIIKLDFDFLPALMIFGLGILFGAFMVIRAVKYLLFNYRSQTIYAILGLMLGSFFAIIQGPTTLEVPKEALSLNTFSVIFAVIGVLLIFGLNRLKTVMDSNV